MTSLINARECVRCHKVKLESEFTQARIPFRACTACMDDYEKEARSRKTDQEMQLRLRRHLEKQERGPLGHLAGPPKHHLLRRIPHRERLNKPLFWYLPDPLRQEAIKRFDQRMPELEHIHGTPVPQIVEAGLIGGIVKTLLYPDQRLKGNFSRRSGVQRKWRLQRYIEEQVAMKQNAMHYQDRLEVA